MKTNRILLNSVTSIFIPTLLFGCGGQPQYDASALLAELQANQEIWNENGYTSYMVDYRGGSAFLGPLASEWKTITVNSGTISEAYITSTSTLIDESEYDDPMIVLMTIEEAFAHVAELIGQRPYMLEVSYDPTYGYPVSIRIDRVSNASEDERGWSYDNFIPVD